MGDKNTYQAQANELSQTLWAIANELRGQMDSSEFKNYILGVIFYRYLSERTELYMAEILENDGITYGDAFADEDYRPVVEEWSLSKLGYVIKPENLFRNLVRKITKFQDDADKFSVGFGRHPPTNPILAYLTKIPLVPKVPYLNLGITFT